MRTNSKKGFTLIELLIVIAIIGILAAVLIPNLMRARQVASYRAAQSYTQNVYKAAFAYVAEDTTHTVVAIDCTNGYIAGEYEAPDPGGVITDCDVTAVNNLPVVTVQATVDLGNGTEIVLPEVTP